jgi:hypothetical protein
VDVILDIGIRTTLATSCPAAPGYSSIKSSSPPSQLRAQRCTHEHAAAWGPGEPDRYWSEQRKRRLGYSRTLLRSIPWLREMRHGGEREMWTTPVDAKTLAHRRESWNWTDVDEMTAGCAQTLAAGQPCPLVV